MLSWYEQWVVGRSKHQELLQEAERERLFNRLRAALQTTTLPQTTSTADARSGQTAESSRGVLTPDRLRPAER